jgi:hypothetical protein
MKVAFCCEGLSRELKPLLGADVLSETAKAK